MFVSMLLSLFGCGPKVIKNVSYDLHGSPMSVQTTYTDKRVATITDAQVTITMGEDVDNKLIQATERLLLDTTILTMGDSGPESVEVHFHEFSKDEKVTTNGETAEKNNKSPLMGLTTVGEFTDGQWIFGLKEGDLNFGQGMMLTMFAQNYEKVNFSYPKSQVMVGDTWEMDPSYIGIIGPKFEKTSDITSQCSFTEVVEIEGVQHAAIDFNFQVDSKTVEKKMNIQADFTGRCLRNLVHFIDTRCTLTGAYNVQMEAPYGPDMVGKVESVNPVQIETTRTLKE